ncbi:MAG TPA: hypothetical protein VMF31_03390 [Solirubrobacterales bacterium]|nr:hypothetical protein [Solirubrobacterales bacterium]
MDKLERHVEVPWESFALEVAAIADVPVSDLGPEIRLVDDLDLDSLALAELAAFIGDSYEVPGGLDEILVSAWNGLTLGQLFERISTSRVPTVGKTPATDGGRE